MAYIIIDELLKLNQQTLYYTLFGDLIDIATQSQHIEKYSEANNLFNEIILIKNRYQIKKFNEIKTGEGNRLDNILNLNNGEEYNILIDFIIHYTYAKIIKIADDNYSGIYVFL